jgi:peroxiredoxin
MWNTPVGLKCTNQRAFGIMPRAMDEDYRVQTPPNPVAPVDDGAADHLAGRPMPPARLPSTHGGESDLGEMTERLAVVYVYPSTGVPGVELPEGWDDIPGARGCTPQSCAFRDHVLELAAYGASVLGVSGQSSHEQREFAQRERIPYPLLSDPKMRLAEALQLPTFEAGGRRFYRRLTFIARARRIAKVFYPVFPPHQNAAEVIHWLAAQPAHGPASARVS